MAHVRPAGPADAAVVAEFNRRLAVETEDKVLDAAVLARGVAAVLADPNRGRYYVAELDGQVVGQMMVTLEWSDWRDGWFWWIQSVYVPLEARRRGVFRALYRFVEQAARKAPDVVGLRLYVERENQAARETYRSLGMIETRYLLLEKYPLD